jgi:hypothetical protein
VSPDFDTTQAATQQRWSVDDYYGRHAANPYDYQGGNVRPLRGAKRHACCSGRARGPSRAVRGSNIVYRHGPTAGLCPRTRFSPREKQYSPRVPHASPSSKNRALGEDNLPRVLHSGKNCTRGRKAHEKEKLHLTAQIDGAV